MRQWNHAIVWRTSHGGYLAPASPVSVFGIVIAIISTVSRSVVVLAAVIMVLISECPIAAFFLPVLNYHDTLYAFETSTEHGLALQERPLVTDHKSGFRPVKMTYQIVEEELLSIRRIWVTECQTGFISRMAKRERVFIDLGSWIKTLGGQNGHGYCPSGTKLDWDWGRTR
jgi:hypothetical protein